MDGAHRRGSEWRAWAMLVLMVVALVVVCFAYAWWVLKPAAEYDPNAPEVVVTVTVQATP